VDERALARFIAKVGLEALAHRAIGAGLSHEELVDNPDLDELRDFVRRGDGPGQWEVARKRLYTPDEVFSDGEDYQVLHEFELRPRAIDEAKGLYDCYFSLVLFGEEFVINMGSPSLDGYEDWRASTEFRPD
jgi:hypothetical protein